MYYFLMGFAIYYIVVGVLFMLNPKKAKKTVLWLVAIVPNELLGLIAIVVGFFLWKSAPLVMFPLFMKILAGLAGIKGVVFATFPVPWITRFYDWISELPLKLFVLEGVFAVVLGIFIFLIIK